MRAKKHFTPITLGAASAAVLLGLAAGSAQAGTIDYAIDESNMTYDVGTGETSIYPSATPTTDPRTGYLVVETDDGVVAPGVGAYTDTDGYTTGGDTYDGCIMSSQGGAAADTTTPCQGAVDTAKRFKLRASQLNEPVDIVFDLTVDANSNRYNVYAKLTNDTGQAAKGFQIQLGTGIGSSFVASSDVDGVLLLPALNKPTVVGKYPGGLFGGSPAEGLPFLDVVPAKFGFTQTGDSISTSGMPSEYTTLFGDWMTEASVPVAYFWDDDGDPRTDDRLLAYQESGTWYTHDKTWTSATLELGDPLLPDTVDLNDDATLLSWGIGENANPYNNPFANLDNFTTDINAANAGWDYTVQDVLDGLLAIYQLNREVVSDGYTGWTMSGVPGEEFFIGDPTYWTTYPVTVRPSSAAPTDPVLQYAIDNTLPVAATWRPECGDEGLYEVHSDYLGVAPFDSLTLLNGVDCDGTTRDNMYAVDDMFTNVVGATDGSGNTYYAIPGYSQGLIEDLANVNLFYSVGLTGAASGPMTLRITTNDVATSAIDPVVSTGSSGGCTVGSAEGKGDWTLPALLAAMLGFGLMRRRRGQAFKA